MFYFKLKNLMFSLKINPNSLVFFNREHCYSQPVYIFADMVKNKGQLL